MTATWIRRAGCGLVLSLLCAHGSQAAPITIARAVASPTTTCCFTTALGGTDIQKADGSTATADATYAGFGITGTSLTSDAFAEASFGTARARATATASAGRTVGDEVGASASASFIDSIWVNGPQTAGFAAVVFSIVLDGDLNGFAAMQGGLNVANSPVLSVSTDYRGSSSFCGFTGACVGGLNAVWNVPVNTWIPILSGVGVAASTKLGFANQSAAAYDRTLHLYIEVPTGFTLRTESGFGYAREVAPGPTPSVPEPSTAALVLLGLGACLGWRRRSARADHGFALRG